MPEFTVRLRNEDGRLCGEREFGEIEIAGGSLAEDYLAAGTPLRDADGFYRSGDLGFLDDGELFVTGRIGDRIKVNGQSLFATDFEQAAEQLPFVRSGRTAVIQSGGRVVVLAAVSPSARADADISRIRIADHLARSVGVSVHPSDVHFVRSGQLPRTSSGKLQRRAIARAFEQGRI
jgi:acyl-CoA synthetase (AMP-forming)/AMP-acid ligase II